MNKILTREDLQMAGRHVQRCSTWLVMREMPVQIIWDFITHPPGWLKLSKTENNKCLWGCAGNYWWECMVSATTLENFLTVSTKTGHTIYLSNKCIMQAQAEITPHNCWGCERQERMRAHFTSEETEKKWQQNATWGFLWPDSIMSFLLLLLFYSLVIIFFFLIYCIG